MNLFQRASLKLPLSPIERSILKLVKSFLLTGLVAILPTINAIITAIATGTFSQNWTQQLYLLSAAFLVAVVHAVAKYFSSQGDFLVGSVIDQIADTISQKMQTPPK